MITRKLVVVALVAMMSAPLAAHAGGGHHGGKHHDSGSHHSGGKHHGGGKHGGKHDKDFCDPKPITEVHGHSVKELYSLFRKFIEEHYS
ncbi:MAG: hypothetical protein VXZ24_00685 [Pseudomonadota bacterium]|nr:hypothetical protein [Pseudomonadota bacterium]